MYGWSHTFDEMTKQLDNIASHITSGRPSYILGKTNASKSLYSLQHF